MPNVKFSIRKAINFNSQQVGRASELSGTLFLVGGNWNLAILRIHIGKNDRILFHRLTHHFEVLQSSFRLEFCKVFPGKCTRKQPENVFKIYVIQDFSIKCSCLRTKFENYRISRIGMPLLAMDQGKVVNADQVMPAII